MLAEDWGMEDGVNMEGEGVEAVCVRIQILLPCAPRRCMGKSGNDAITTSKDNYGTPSATKR